MPIQRIPEIINGVIIQFASCVNREVDSRVVDAMKHCIHKIMGPGDDHRLFAVWVSSANDSHKYPSRHAQAKAVDISRLNGLKMSVSPDEATKFMTKALQHRFERYEHRRENFGPFLKLKLGKQKEITGHKDHIHWSVN